MVVARPLRMDPTRTATLRRTLVLKVRRQFAVLRQRLLKLVAEDNAFGLTTNRWQFASDSAKVDEFTQWIKQQAADVVHGKTEEQLWQEYAKQAMSKGASKSFDDVNASVKAEAEGDDGDKLPLFKGGKKQFLEDSFRQPVSVDRLKILASRSFTDLKGVTDDMALKMRRTLVDGLARGDNPRALADDLAKQIGISSRRAETIARTEIIRAHAEGQLLAMERMGVSSVGVDVEWSTAGDDRVCPVCESMEGKVYTLAEAHGKIPMHPNCLPGNSLVLSRSGIAATSKRWFDGYLVVMRTSAGRELSCTPNHPVLTDRGWVPARLLRVGSNVVCDGGVEWETARHYDDDNVPTSIHEVTESFRRSRQVFSVEVPVSAPHFHGDGVDGEVAVIRTNRQLRCDVDTAQLEFGHHCNLIRRRKRQVTVTCFGASTEFIERRFSTSTCLISSGHLHLTRGVVHHRPLNDFGLRLTPTLHTGVLQNQRHSTSRHAESISQRILRLTAQVCRDDNVYWQVDKSPNRSVFTTENTSDNFVRDVELARDILNGSSGTVFLDKIVTLRVEKFSGHVYNLETGRGFYAANGIITHNCRCAFLPHFGNLPSADDNRTVDPVVSPAERCREAVDDQRAKFDADLEALDQQHADELSDLEQRLDLAKDRADNERAVLGHLQGNLTGDEEEGDELLEQVDDAQQRVEDADGIVEELQRQLDELPAQQAEDRQQLADDQSDQIDELTQRCDEVEEML